ncbi:hypothetical protein VM1G_09400 [Cytospora mali]|uniref:Uncharacterized protein n=1 Tax=Cytospora mali TaxID=578113 RepID=A0A194WC18_CYTMA|nr:hypothetical protein VM1G_09400 [Valsa mali]
MTWTPMARLALGRIASRNKRKQKHNTTQSKGLLHDMPYAATTAQFIVADCLADRWRISDAAQTGSSTRVLMSQPILRNLTGSSGYYIVEISAIYRDRGLLVSPGPIAADKAHPEN